MKQRNNKEAHSREFYLNDFWNKQAPVETESMTSSIPHHNLCKDGIVSIHILQIRKVRHRDQIRKNNPAQAT